MKPHDKLVGPAHRRDTPPPDTEATADSRLNTVSPLQRSAKQIRQSTSDPRHIVAQQDPPHDRDLRATIRRNRFSVGGALVSFVVHTLLLLILGTIMLAWPEPPTTIQITSSLTEQPQP